MADPDGGRGEHRIRLPQPWKVESTCIPDPNRADVRLWMHEFQRSFQRPTGLTPQTQVSLAVVFPPDIELPHRIDCRLNETLLSMVHSAERLVRFQLNPEALLQTNKVRVTLVCPEAQSVAVLPDVSLRIT